MKKYFISFGNEKFKNQLNRICTEAVQTGWFDGVIAENTVTIQDFISDHKDFFDNNPRGCGYWIWKPFIMLKQISKMNEGDYLFYTDAGSRILPHRKDVFDSYLELLDNQPVLISGEGSPYLQKQFIKLSLLKEFGLENDFQFLNSSMSEGGLVAIRKCEESIDFLNEWLDVMIKDDYNLVNDNLINEKQLEGFSSHRHDQSVLNVMFKVKGYKSLSVTNCYGLGPFFHSRETDEGYRKFAPDWWRAEPDFDYDAHPTFDHYINSKQNPDWWKQQDDYNESMLEVKDYLRLKWSKYTEQ